MAEELAQRETLEQQVAQLQTAKSTAEQERDKLKKEHANCSTTIQTLAKEKQTLQKQLAELNAIITGAPLMETEMEARVQQSNLPPQ